MDDAVTFGTIDFFAPSPLFIPSAIFSEPPADHTMDSASVPGFVECLLLNSPCTRCQLPLTFSQTRLAPAGIFDE